MEPWELMHREMSRRYWEAKREQEAPPTRPDGLLQARCVCGELLEQDGDGTWWHSQFLDALHPAQPVGPWIEASA